MKALAVALNTPLVDPDGIVSEGGTVKLGEPEFRLMVPPPDPLRVTVHAAEESGPNVAGLQVIAAMLELIGETTSASVVDLEELLSVAVTVTV